MSDCNGGAGENVAVRVKWKFNSRRLVEYSCKLDRLQWCVPCGQSLNVQKLLSDECAGMRIAFLVLIMLIEPDVVCGFVSLVCGRAESQARLCKGLSLIPLLV
jgi:hypothetical protein